MSNIIQRYDGYGDKKAIIIFLKKVIVYKVYENNRFKDIINNYHKLLKNGLPVPKIYSFNLTKRYFIQEKIIGKTLQDLPHNPNIIYSVLDDLFLLYKKTKTKISSFEKIRFRGVGLKITSDDKTIGSVIKLMTLKLLKDGVYDRNKLKQILLIIENNKESFQDKYLYFVHRDLNSSNILINENNRHYFIDYYPNSYFDYYYDLACLYQYNDYKKEFLYYLKKNNIKINYARFKVNLLLIEAKKKKKILY